VTRRVRDHNNLFDDAALGDNVDVSVGEAVGDTVGDSVGNNVNLAPYLVLYSGLQWVHLMVLALAWHSALLLVQCWVMVWATLLA
jgi:hypothetical protein